MKSQLGILSAKIITYYLILYVFSLNFCYFFLKFHARIDILYFSWILFINTQLWMWDFERGTSPSAICWIRIQSFPTLWEEYSSYSGLPSNSESSCRNLTWPLAFLLPLKPKSSTITSSGSAASRSSLSSALSPSQRYSLGLS